MTVMPPVRSPDRVPPGAAPVGARAAGLIAIMAAVALLVVACGSGGSAGGDARAPVAAGTAPSGAAGAPSPSAATPSSPPAAASSGLTAKPGARAAGDRKVLVVVEENKAYEDIIGSADAPYLNDLARRFGTATAYDAGYPANCPSLAAYVILTSGDDHGICDDDPPSKHPLSGDNLFRQVAASGRQWRVYAQSMPQPCAAETVGSYLVKHNPATYYTSERTRCASWDVPLGSPEGGTLKDDVASGLPAVSFVIPDACSDMHGGHGCPDDRTLIRKGDTWLGRWIPVIMSGPDYREGKLVVIVTWDESSSQDHNHIPTLIISPTTTHIQDATPQTHCTLLRTMDDLLALPPLGCAVTATPATTRFRL